MALKIRMQRGGKTHSPRYRMVVAESSARRDGRFVEILGNYNPQARKNEKEFDLKLDRIDHWLSVGAKPSDTCRTIINKVRRSVDATPEASAPAVDEKPAAEPKTEEAAVEAPAEEPETKAEEAEAKTEEPEAKTEEPEAETEEASEESPSEEAPSKKED